MWSIKNKSFMITGGANGLGAAYAESFLKEGAENIAILDVDEVAGKKLTQKLNETYGKKTIFVKCDATEEQEIADAFEEVIKQMKRVDVIINNAGIMNDAEEVWRKACDLNWQGLVSFTRRGVSHMRVDEGGAGGTIVNVSSIAGILKLPTVPAYAGSKAAVLHFSLSLAAPPFHEKTGIHILTVCLGVTRTTLMQDLVNKSVDKEAAAKFEQQFPYSTYQPVENAVAGMLKILKEGQNGSVWLAARSREAEDVTQLLNEAQEEFAKVLINGLNPTEQNKDSDPISK